MLGEMTGEMGLDNRLLFNTFILSFIHSFMQRECGVQHLIFIPWVEWTFILLYSLIGVLACIGNIAVLISIFRFSIYTEEPVRGLKNIYVTTLKKKIVSGSDFFFNPRLRSGQITRIRNLWFKG